MNPAFEEASSALAEEVSALVYSAAQIGFRFDAARQRGDWSAMVQGVDIGEVFAQLTVECFRAHLTLMTAGATRAEATEKLVAEGWANKLAPHFLMLNGVSP